MVLTTHIKNFFNQGIFFSSFYI